jgi:hypothetical protein
MRKLWIIACVAALAGCVSSQESGVKVIVGAKLEQPGQPAIDYSVVVIENGKVRAAGPQSTTPVPKGGEITSGLGMTIEPAPGGRIETGQPANLVLKGAAERTMRNGEWTNQ